jgi:hypothetical protein
MKVINHAQKDKISKFTSHIIKDCITEFSTFYDPIDCPEDIVVFDPENRFFVVLTDQMAKFARTLNFTGRPPDDYIIPRMGMSVPVVRAVYVHPKSRGKGVQQNVFSILIAMSEAHQEPFYAHAKPFEVPNPQLNTDARSAFSGYYSLGIVEDRAPKGEREKQRKRLQSYGLVSCTPTNGSLKAPEYDLAYIPRSAPKDVHDLILGVPAT